MYVPPASRETRRPILIEAIRGLQLGALVTPGAEGIEATHLPFVAKDAEGALILEGHVARPNPHWRGLGAGAPSVAIFQGPQAYVSPSFYPSKREHGRVVPTWTYIAVHAHGRLEAVEDEAWLSAHLDDLTRMNEAKREQPWAVGDAPPEFTRALTRAIVGLRLTVERLEGAWKLIQHRPAGDRAGTIEGLGASLSAGDQAVAAAMRGLEAERRP